MKAMFAACKLKDPVPLKSNANLKIHGTRLLLHSAWNWTAISGNSRSREFRLIAGAAVLEFNIIAEYREQLLDSTPAAVVLRTSLAAELQPHMRKLSTCFSKFKPGSTPDAQLAFADRITPALPLSEASFAVERNMSLWQFYRDMEEYRVSVQKIVYAVEKCPLAWQDPGSESKSPPLSEGVHALLQRLVNVSSSILLVVDRFSHTRHRSWKIKRQVIVPMTKKIVASMISASVSLFAAAMPRLSCLLVKRARTIQNLLGVKNYHA